MIAEGRATAPLTHATAPVSPEAAGQAARDGYMHWTAGHPFPICVVCGPDRADGLGVFPGALGDGRFAANWIPDASPGR